MRYVLEFDSAEELQAVLALLKNPAAAERPPMALVNRTPQTLELAARMSNSGMLNIEVFPRLDKQAPTTTVKLPPGQTYQLG